MCLTFLLLYYHAIATFAPVYNKIAFLDSNRNITVKVFSSVFSTVIFSSQPSLGESEKRVDKGALISLECRIWREETIVIRCPGYKMEALRHRHENTKV